MDIQDWRIVAVSVIGTSHTKASLPCQDAHACAVLEGDVVVLIASDGAGSAKHAEVGASLAVSELMDSIRGHFDDGRDLASVTREIAHGWLENVSSRIAHQAELDGATVRDFACTILAAIVSPTHACCVQIGDGAIVMRNRGDYWAYVFWPQHGEYANTTAFVTEPEALASFEFMCSAQLVDEVAVFTDGLEALVLHFASKSVHGPFFDSSFRAVRALPEGGQDQDLSDKLGSYLGSAAICDRTDDDKTLLLASRTTAPAPVPAPESATEA